MLVVVPVMMQRILELPAETRRKYDVSSLKVVAASGSALPGELATGWMDEFGDNLYNLYGSTEVAWAIDRHPGGPARRARAPPARRRAARSSSSTTSAAAEVPPGETGRIFVGNEMLFEGYTGGGSKDVIDGLMATGDVGRFDAEGRLFVEGRDDEMIVSGGENVFPARGRGHARAPPGRLRGRRDRRGRQGLRPAPAGVRRARGRLGGSARTS